MGDGEQGRWWRQEVGVGQEEEQLAEEHREEVQHPEELRLTKEHGEEGDYQKEHRVAEKLQLAEELQYP
jgi:hypothetical protein